MAKGILDKVDTTQQQDNGNGLSYQVMEQYNPSPAPKPAMGTLKKILSATKESEQFSPYKKSAPKPVEIKRKTAKPSMLPVEAPSPITQDILEPIVDINTQANTDLKLAVENTVAKKFNTGTIPEDVYRKNLTEGIQSGDFKVTEDEAGNKEIIRTAPTVLKAFADGWNSYFNQFQDAIIAYNPLVPEEDKIKAREAKRRDASIVLEEEASKAREYGGMAGQMGAQIVTTLLPVGQAAVGARIAKVGVDAIKISTANSALQAAIGALTTGNQGEEETYNIMRDKGLSEQESYDIAKANRFTYLATGALEGVVSTLADAKIAKVFGASTKKAGEGFLNATKAYLTKAKEPSASLALDASVAGIMSSIRDLSTQSTTGVDIDVLGRAWDNAKQELIAGGAIATISGGVGSATRKIDKWYKSQATNYLSTLDRKFVEEELRLKQSEGIMTEAQVNDELAKIDEWNKIRKENPNVPEEKQPTVYGLILKKKQLQDALKNGDESGQADTEEQIRIIDNRIANANINLEPLAGEVDDQGVQLIPEPQQITTETEVNPTEVAPIEISQVIKQKAKESPENVANAASMVFKDAGYHIGSLPGKSDYLQPGYSGEQPFTGYYFVSNPKDVVKGGSRFGDPSEFRIVDFSQYNLYKPSTDEYWRTKSNLKSFVNNSGNFDEAYDGFINKIKYTPIISSRINDYNRPKELEDELNKIEKALDNTKSNREFTELTKRWEEINSLIVAQKGKDNFKEDLRKELDAYNKKGWDKNQYGDESKERFETIMLKMLGFEGVDVRGLKSEQGLGSPDKFAEGSVVFDLKPESVQTLWGAYENAKTKGDNPELVNNIDNIIKPKEDATTISQGQQQEGATEGNIGQRQGTEGEQAQAPNEPNNSNSTVGSETQQEVTRPEVFSTQEQKNVFEKMRNEADKQYAADETDTRGATQKAIKILKNSDFFKKLNKNDREQYVAAATEYFSGKRKTAPSVAKILGEAKPNEITVNEKVALKRLLKFGEASATGAIKFSNNVKNDILTGLKALGKKGTIKVTQINAIMNKFNNLNVTSDKNISRFVDYASKIISDANYDAKLKEANRLKKLIAKNASRKNSQVNLSNSAKDFTSINPSDVDNIDDYIGVAGAVLKGVKTSRATKDMGVDFAQPFSDKDVNEYTSSQKKYIEDYAKAEKMADYQDLVDSGIISADMTFDEMDTIISGIEDSGNKDKAPKDKEKNIRSYISKRIDSLSAIAKSLLENGTDGFGVDVDMEITEEQRRVLNSILSKDVNNMSLPDAYRVAEALANFVTNGKTSGLDAIVARYNGNQESIELQKSGIKSRPLKLLFSTNLAQLWDKAFDSLPMRLVKMFGSINAPKVQRAMGITDLENGKNRAVKTHSDTEKRFVKEFKGRQANGEDYNTSYNIIERGMLAWLRRNSGGSDAEVQAEFDRRKALIEESIDSLSKSTSGADLKKAELYQRAYDKLISESNNITDVESKTDATNIEAVDWWTNEWAKHYDNLRDVSINVYNQDLGKDNNYNPDVYSKMEDQEDTSDVFENSGFTSKYDYIPQKKSGTLIQSVKPTSLPDGRVIDLSFDMNNSRALKYALIDINTAASVRKVDAFLKAPTTAKMINKEDLAILKSSISDFIKRSRGMEGIDASELKSVQKVINSASRFVTSTALVGLGQPFKQTIPLIIKTIVSTKGKFSVKEALELMNYKNSPVGKFLDESGYGISIRGEESSTGVMSIDRVIKESANGFGDKVARGFDKWNENLLKAFVSMPDKWVARAAWITYYKSKLKDMGVDTSNMDWNNHEINQEAADFAQSMIDTQQNVSDRDLMGSFMGSKNANTTFARTILMPFSNFVMNAKSKTQADIVNMVKGASKEEKVAAALSFSGTILEMAVFNAITGAIGVGLSGLAAEDETSEKEEEAKWNVALKSAVSNFASDLLSPVPQTNALIGKGINAIIDLVDKDTPEELKLRLYGESEKPIYQDFGLFGIGAKKAVDTYDAWQKSVSGQVKTDYFGKETIKNLPEDEKENVKIAAIIHTLVNFRIIPIAEAASLANKIVKNAERRALTEKQTAYSEAVANIKIPDTGKIVEGEDISKAMSKALSYKDPESRAKYLISLSEKYGDDFTKSLELAEEAKILDKATAANFIAIKSGSQDNIDISRLFSYKNQDARVKKMSDLRSQAIAEDRLSEFYEGFKFGNKFGLLNESGLLLYVERIGKDIDADSEEAQMLLSAIEN